MLFKQKHRFSIRKFSFGVCSALLGTALIMGADSASASETDASAETQAADTSSDTSTDPDSAATATTSETDSEPVATTATETSEPAADTTADQTETAATETTESTSEPATTEAASETNSTEATPTETVSEPTTEEKAATETTEPATTETTTKVSAPTREEAFPNEGESIPTGTYFRAPLEAVAQTAPTGTQVTPEVTVVSSHEGLSETPTIKNKDGTSIQFSFGDQPLHQGDYFYVETQDVPIALPRTFRIKSSETDGEGTVIANVERVSYESDFVKATDSEDPTRFDLKNDSTLTTMAIKYKVTFTEAVEGLKDVSATISGSGSKQTLAATVDRPTEFKVKINDKTVYTSVYTEPAWDDANSANFKRSHFNTGLEGVVTDQFGNRNEIEYDTGNREKLHAYLSMEATVYDYRSNTPGSDIGFLTETISEGLVVLSGQVGGMPDGFVTTVSSPTDPNKNTYTWDVDKLEIGQKLPVYYIPFQDIGTEEKHPNADNGKLYVTPDNMYYTIESISDDKRTITLKFHGDYTKPGRIVTSFKNPMEDFEQGKSSRLGINFDKDSFVDVGGSTDNSTITVSHPDGTPLSNFEMPNAKSLIYGDTKPDLVQQGEDGLTSRAVRLNYDATATGIPVETTNPEQINKGTVIVQYVDVNGNVLQQEKVDVADVDVDTDYDTVTDNRPQEITVGDKTYELVPAGDYTVGSVSDQGNLTTSKLRDVYASSDVNGVEPTGKVTQGTNYVTYVYKEKTAVVKEGTVTVNYKDEDGNVIKDPVVDTPASPVDTPYNTTDNRPEKITTEDGKTYQRVPEKTEGTEEGNVVEGTTEVTYVYKEVKGDVIVHYIDTEGNVIADDATDTPTTSTGTDYNTADDNKPNTITKDGVTYELVPALTKGNETGKVVEGTTEVTYVYKKVEAPVQPEPTPEAPTGDVIVHYVDEEGNTIADDKVDTQGSKIDTPYDTTDNRPERITTPDGKTYERVPEKTEGTETGSVVEGTTEVTYVYKEVKGDVIVHYIDTEGNVIADDAVDTPETSTGTDYNTADDNKPTTITKDGVKYELVPVLTKGNEQGKVVEGTTEITYVYKKVEDPTTPEVPNEDPGKYIPYIPVDPENPTDPNDPKDNPPVDPNTGDPIDPIDYDETPEDPTDNPPIPDVDGFIPVDPNDPTEPLKPKDPNDPTQGYEPPKPVDPKEDTPVPYVPAGSITVHYVDEDGNVIKDPTVDTPKSPVGTEYNTNENGEEIPKEITGKDGKVYELVKVKDGDEETGKVVKGNTDVTYIYKVKDPTTPEVPNEDPGKYIPYIPVDPENPTDPNDPLNPPVDPNTGDPIDPIDYDETPEDPTDNPPIPDIDGYIPVDPKDPTQPLKPKDPNDPTKGYEPPKPVDPKEDTPVPYVPAGSITVHYVDEDGNVIKDPTVDTPKSPVGTEYNTNENGEEIPKEIIGKDGKVYVLVKVKDGDEETGKVGKGNKDVTYIYKLKEDPENPTTPEKPEEPNKPEQPKNPGNENPGNENPGDGNPGDENPGNGNPGNGNPGNGNPGDGNPGNENPGNGNPGNGNPGMDQPSETMKDKDAKDMKQADKAMDKELPETGNTNNPFVTAFGFLTLLAGARLTRRKRREED